MLKPGNWRDLNCTKEEIAEAIKKLAERYVK